MGDECIRVAVRVRPLVKTELDTGCQNVLTKTINQPQLVVKNNDPFTFNYAFAQDDSQEKIYEIAVAGMLDKLFKGYNVTILAYGQTGSGKTYTMGTSYNGVMDSETGVIPRAIDGIFSTVDNLAADYQFKITCSFMELYQEHLFDLLSNNSREQSVVDIREDGNKGIIIPGLTEIDVVTVEQTTHCLLKGSCGRAVGATAMNEQSSRSHAIFTITVQMMRNNDSKTSTISKFNLVDLAGSERSKKTKATGDRFKEGVKINQGLLALGNVISILGSSQGGGFVGYRDSKLTRLLQDSLGGNSVTLMIACVSPADFNMDETLSTLRYADRARKIKNKPIINQDPQAAEINRLNGIIQSLRLKLISNGAGVSCKCSGTKSKDVTPINHDFETMRKNVQNLQQQLHCALQDVAEVELRSCLAETANDNVEKKIQELQQSIKDLRKEIHADSTEVSASFPYIQKINNMAVLIDELENMLRGNKEEILNHKLLVPVVNTTISLNSLGDDESSEDIQQKSDAFTTKQIEFNNKLKLLNRELNLKEEYHQKVAGSLTNMYNYQDENTVANMDIYEMKIQELETEKLDLLDKLKHAKVNVSAKIAEERRKRLQQLEADINNLRKTNLQQSKILKICEKESKKVINITKEIEEMKAAKVKLIRKMKSESEIFRKWKFNREKELTQLKEKGRKRENEMVRMEVLHNKQKNILKRKVDQAMAINKRLKDVLERQKSSKNTTKFAGNHTGKPDQLHAWIDNELAVITSVIDAQYSLDQLMADRAVITKRLNNFKRLQPQNITEINSIEEDLEMRNAQIDDLQQKILLSDIDTKIKGICENVENLPDAKLALKYIFATIAESRREYAAKDSKICEFKVACEAADTKNEFLKNDLEAFETKHREEIANIEKSYEDKIIILLRELTSKSNQAANTSDITPETQERIKIQEETLDKIEELRDELERYKTKCYALENNVKRGLRPQNKHLNIETHIENCESDSSIDDRIKDPDWNIEFSRTSWKRSRTGNTSNNTSNEQKKKIKNSLEDISDPMATKRSSEGKFLCNCRAGCKTKKCSCRAVGFSCNEKCGCGISCANQEHALEENHSINENDDINKENVSQENIIQVKDENLKSPEDLECTPPPKVLSDGNIDRMSPVYPYSVKKRKPFYDD